MTPDAIDAGGMGSGNGREIDLTFTGRRLLAFDREIRTTCIVRNEINGWRARDEVVKTKGQTTPRGLAYYPRQFPPGRWQITRVEGMLASTEYWPCYIDTDATQELVEWEIDERGRYTGPTDRVIVGRGYGIHHARIWTPNGWIASNSTLGCLNVLNPDDAYWLGDEIVDAFGFHKRVFVNVPPWDEWEA